MFLLLSSICELHRFLCLSPVSVCKRNEVTLLCCGRWGRESLLSIGHICHNTTKQKACKTTSGVL